MQRSTGHMSSVASKTESAEETAAPFEDRRDVGSSRAYKSSPWARLKASTLHLVEAAAMLAETKLEGSFDLHVPIKQKKIVKSKVRTWQAQSRTLYKSRKTWLPQPMVGEAVRYVRGTAGTEESEGVKELKTKTQRKEKGTGRRFGSSFYDGLEAGRSLVSELSFPTVGFVSGGSMFENNNWEEVDDDDCNVLSNLERELHLKKEGYPDNVAPLSASNHVMSLIKPPIAQKYG